MMTTQGSILEALFKSLPHSDQVRAIDLPSGGVVFSWRGHRFRVGTEGLVSVWELEESGLEAMTDLAILVEGLIRRAMCEQKEE